jgi:MFS transporter, MHS family, proline/betaine transporter
MQLVLVVFLAFYAGAAPATYAEIFPTRVRYTALSIGYNIAVAVFGGFAPFIATSLIDLTGGNKIAPTFYVLAAAVVTFLILTRTRETAFSPLQ